MPSKQPKSKKQEIKKKGSEWERAVSRLFREEGFPDSERMVQKGMLDMGDITGVPGLTVEAKSTKEFNPSIALDEAKKEQLNRETRWAVAILKRANRNRHSAYAVMKLIDFVHLYRQYRVMVAYSRELSNAFQAMRDYVDNPSQENFTSLRQCVSSAESAYHGEVVQIAQGESD